MRKKQPHSASGKRRKKQAPGEAPREPGADLLLHQPGDPEYERLLKLMQERYPDGIPWQDADDLGDDDELLGLSLGEYPGDHQEEAAKPLPGLGGVPWKPPGAH